MFLVFGGIRATRRRPYPSRVSESAGMWLAMAFVSVVAGFRAEVPSLTSLRHADIENQMSCCPIPLSRFPQQARGMVLIEANNTRRISIRGGSDLLLEEDIIENWDMVTGVDIHNVSITYLQLRKSPFTIVELWWDSGGRFRFTYEATGSDVMGAWPQGSTSNMSGWDVDSLVEEIKRARGTAAIPARRLELGRWRLEVQDRFINITNTEQSENELLLTDFGFVFFDCLGRALINRGMD